MNRELARKRATAGALLLMERVREPWWRPTHFDLEHFDIDNAEMCILGQVFNENPTGRAGYYHAVFEWGLTSLESWEYGFLAPSDLQGYDGNVAILNEVWAELILELRSADEQERDPREVLASRVARPEQEEAA